MEKKIKIIVSKDAMCKDYLHFYGEKAGQFPTPNLDELVKKGTLFCNHVTAAPSTVMSFYSMAMGKFAHETEYEIYERCHDMVKGETIFSKLSKKGYKCHIIWDTMWDPLKDYYDYFRDDVVIHSVVDLRESVGVHKQNERELFVDNEKGKVTMGKVENLLGSIIAENDEKIFIWLHLPHVLSGRACYGSDIDLFDEYVGMVRRYIPDDGIIITADHGNMNGLKGKLAYGFDVYDKVIKVPLIVPKIDNIDRYFRNTSSVDLYDIVFCSNIPERKFVYSDSAYRAQKHRKLAILFGTYKYIYNKKNGTEELYDLKFDPNEQFSIISDVIYDVDRKIKTSVREQYYYPNWLELPEIINMFRTEKERIWRKGTFMVVLKSNIKDLIRPLYEAIIRKIRR